MGKYLMLAESFLSDGATKKIKLYVLDKYLKNNPDIFTKVKNAISKMNKHIKQYNKNNNTSFPFYTIASLNILGLIKDYIRQSLSNDQQLNFILLHHHIGWRPDNIMVGNRKIRENKLISLDIKFCGFCNKFHKKTEFKDDQSKYDKLNSVCNSCLIKYLRTKDTLIRRMYNRQVHSSKERNHCKPSYTFEWYKEWCMKQELFHRLYDNWVKNNYNKKYTPSGDRIDSRKPYTKNNIQLMTWDENDKKGKMELRKKVYRYNLNGKLIKVYNSKDSIKKELKISHINYYIDNRRIFLGSLWENEKRNIKRRKNG